MFALGNASLDAMATEACSSRSVARSVILTIFVQAEDGSAYPAGFFIIEPTDAQNLATIRKTAALPIADLLGQGVRIFDEVIEPTVGELDESLNLLARLRPAAPPEMSASLPPERLDA